MWYCQWGGEKTHKKVMLQLHTVDRRKTAACIWSNMARPTHSVCPWKTLTEWMDGSLKSHSLKVVSLDDVTTKRWVGWVQQWVSSWSWPENIYRQKSLLHSSSEKTISTSKHQTERNCFVLFFLTNLWACEPALKSPPHTSWQHDPRRPSPPADLPPTNQLQSLHPGGSSMWL